MKIEVKDGDYLSEVIIKNRLHTNGSMYKWALSNEIEVGTVAFYGETPIGVAVTIETPQEVEQFDGRFVMCNVGCYVLPSSRRNRVGQQLLSALVESMPKEYYYWAENDRDKKRHRFFKSGLGPMAMQLFVK